MNLDVGRIKCEGIIMNISDHDILIKIKISKKA